VRIKVNSQPVSTPVFAFVILFAAGFVSTPARAADDGTCIGDIRQVIARGATPMMMKATLPKDLTAKVDAAAQASLA
jgi:D-alanyl-D-alanine carboxypeptidase